MQSNKLKLVYYLKKKVNVYLLKYYNMIQEQMENKMWYGSSQMSKIFL